MTLTLTVDTANAFPPLANDCRTLDPRHHSLQGNTPMPGSVQATVLIFSHETSSIYVNRRGSHCIVPSWHAHTWLMDVAKDCVKRRAAPPSYPRALQATWADPGVKRSLLQTLLQNPLSKISRRPYS